MLDQIPLFAALPTEALARLETLTRQRQVARNTLLMNAGEPAEAMYLIISGAVKVFLSDEDGKEVTLALLETGDYVGEMALIDEQPRSASVITTEDSTLCSLSKSAFNKCLAEHPEIARYLMRELVQRLRDADRKISSLALLDVYGRIAQLLLELATREGNLLVVAERLSQQEIANRIGASREMVSKIMKDLAQRGHIHVEKKRIIIYPSLMPRP